MSFLLTTPRQPAYEVGVEPSMALPSEQAEPGAKFAKAFASVNLVRSQRL